MNHRVTISDLSKNLGISESTISKALNNRSDVSEAVKILVRAKAAELGYTPNAQARKLAMKTSGAIGVFLLNRFDRSVDSYFGFQFLGGIMKEAQDRALDVLLFSENDILKTTGYIGYCRQKGVEGAIFIGLAQEDPQLEEIGRSEFPTVSIDTPIPSSVRGFLTSDNVGGIESLVDHVFNSRKQKIGFVGIKGCGFIANIRQNAYIQKVTHLGCHYPEWILEAPLSLEGGKLAGLTLLSKTPRPDALVCASDLQALGVLQAAQELNIKVPQDLAVTGFDDIQAAAFSNPSLTTYSQNTFKIGCTAVMSLLSTTPDPSPQILSGSLIQRCSS